MTATVMALVAAFLLGALANQLVFWSARRRLDFREGQVAHAEWAAGLKNAKGQLAPEPPAHRWRRPAPAAAADLVVPVEANATYEATATVEFKPEVPAGVTLLEPVNWADAEPAVQIGWLQRWWRSARWRDLPGMVAIAGFVVARRVRSLAVRVWDAVFDGVMMVASLGFAVVGWVEAAGLWVPVAWRAVRWRLAVWRGRLGVWWTLRAVPWLRPRRELRRVQERKLCDEAEMELQIELLRAQVEALGRLTTQAAAFEVAREVQVDTAARRAALTV